MRCNVLFSNRKAGSSTGTGGLRRSACNGLLCAMVVGMLASGGTAWAQNSDTDSKAAAAAAAAAAQAKAHAAALARERAQVFAKLAAQVRQLREKEAAIQANREHDARQALEKQQHLLNQAQARFKAAEARSHVLDGKWKKNAEQIANTRKLLIQHQGNLGELYGVVRQVAANASDVMKKSLITTQFEPPPGQLSRSVFLTQLAKGHAVPTDHDFHRLWYELLRAIVATGDVVRYKTGVLPLGEVVNAVPREVVRIGPFTAVNGNEYLGYLSTADALTELKGNLPGIFTQIAYNLTHAAPDSGYTTAVVDPAAGAILARYLTRPSWLQRINMGEAVGYVIIAIGLIGLLLAVVQYIYLFFTHRAMSRQLKDIDNPQADNPVGRLVLTLEGESKQEKSARVAESRVADAVQREVPGLERFQSVIRLVVAAGPLLGLIGTVTGMILTFHAIVASGSTNPTIMAGGIGHAMIATVLGLIVAVPLLFIVTGLNAVSGKLVRTLEEFGDSLLANEIVEDQNNSV